MKKGETETHATARALRTLPPLHAARAGSQCTHLKPFPTSPLTFSNTTTARQWHHFSSRIFFCQSRCYLRSEYERLQRRHGGVKLYQSLYSGLNVFLQVLLSKTFPTCCRYMQRTLKTDSTADKKNIAITNHQIKPWPPFSPLQKRNPHTDGISRDIIWRAQSINLHVVSMFWYICLYYNNSINYLFKWISVTINHN